MTARRESRLERLVMSLSRHRRRRGASEQLVSAPDIAVMKSLIIDEGPPVLVRGRSKQLDQHIENLRSEFSGQSQLLWHHAKLIVLIRREFRTADTYAQFRSLWDAECAFLCEHLNLRWLVSAADTFADHDRDSMVRSTALMAALLVNLIKLHETERHLCDPETIVPSPNRIARVRNELVPLFEGMPCLAIGTDDTLCNLWWRLQTVFEVEPTGAILKTVWDRCQVENTAFGRIRKMHERQRTKWWDDEH